MWILIYFKELYTNKVCEIYINSMWKKFTMLQEIVYSLACEYLYTMYLAWIFGNKKGE